MATARAFLDKEQYTVPLYHSIGKVPEQIYAGTLPTTIVLAKNGKIRLHHTGVADYGTKKFIRQINELIEE